MRELFPERTAQFTHNTRICMMTHGTMKRSLLTAVGAAALVIGAGNAAMAQIDTICNPAEGTVTYSSTPPACLYGGGSSLAAEVYQLQFLAHYGALDGTFAFNYSSIGSSNGHHVFEFDAPSGTLAGGSSPTTFDTNGITPSGVTIA